MKEILEHSCKYLICFMEEFFEYKDSYLPFYMEKEKRINNIMSRISQD